VRGGAREDVGCDGLGVGEGRMRVGEAVWGVRVGCVRVRVGVRGEG